MIGSLYVFNALLYKLLILSYLFSFLEMNFGEQIQSRHAIFKLQIKFSNWLYFDIYKYYVHTVRAIFPSIDWANGLGLLVGWRRFNSNFIFNHSGQVND